MAPSRLALAAAVLAALAAAASAAVTPTAAAALVPVDKAAFSDVTKGLAAPGLVVVTTWKLNPGVDAAAWVKTRNAISAKAKKELAFATMPVVYFKAGTQPPAAKLKKGEAYAEAGSISSLPSNKEYAAMRAFFAKDEDYAATQAQVKEVTRAINVDL